MDVIELNVWAKPGKPAAVGHIGTVVLGGTNEAGETLVKFTLRRKGARKLGMSYPPKLDRRGGKAQD